MHAPPPQAPRLLTQFLRLAQNGDLPWQRRFLAMDTGIEWQFALDQAGGDGEPFEALHPKA